MTQAQRLLQRLDEVAPKNWEGTVLRMKRHKEISNPYALSYWLRSRGAKPHYTESGKKKEKYKE